MAPITPHTYSIDENGFNFASEGVPTGYLQTPPASSPSTNKSSDNGSPSDSSNNSSLTPAIIACVVHHNGDEATHKKLPVELSPTSLTSILPPLTFNDITIRQILHQFVKSLNSEKPGVFYTRIFEEDYRPRGELRTYKPHGLEFRTPTLKYPDGRELEINCDIQTRKYHSHWTGPQCDEVGNRVPDEVKIAHRVEINSKGEDYAVWQYSVIIRAQDRAEALAINNWTSFEFRIPQKYALVDGVMQEVEPKWIDVLNTARAAVSRWAYKIPYIEPLSSIGISPPGSVRVAAPQQVMPTTPPPPSPDPQARVTNTPHQSPTQRPNGTRLTPAAIRRMAMAQAQGPIRPPPPAAAPARQIAIPHPRLPNPAMQAYMASVLPRACQPPPPPPLTATLASAYMGASAFHAASLDMDPFTFKPRVKEVPPPPPPSAALLRYQESVLGKGGMEGEEGPAKRARM